MTYKPWMPKEAIKFMDSILTPASWVIEHGSGYSTIWLAKKVDYLISYESDPKWYTKIGGLLYKEGLLDHTILIHATDIAEKGALLPRNAPRGAVYDLLYIDGRGRVRMWEDHKRSIKPGGWVCFDDAERGKYRKFHDDTEGWERRTFYKARKRRYLEGKVMLDHEFGITQSFIVFARKPNA